MSNHFFCMTRLSSALNKCSLVAIANLLVNCYHGDYFTSKYVGVTIDRKRIPMDINNGSKRT
jgi:hypothetical protein